MSHRYIDIAESGKINTVVQKRLKSMRENITFYMSKDNRHSFDVPWTSDGLTPTTNNCHHKYAESFSAAVAVKIRTMFDVCLTEECDIQCPVSGKEGVFCDALANLNYCAALTDNHGFIATLPTLSALKDRFSDGSQSEHCVVLLYGATGAGKSCTVSHVAMSVNDYLTDAIVILRYADCCPLTHEHGNIFDCKLKSISHQLSLISKCAINLAAKDSDVIKTSLRKISYYLLQQNKQLLIVIDGRLSYVDLATNMNQYVHFLTTTLPARIHVVITVSLQDTETNNWKTLLNEMKLTKSSVMQTELCENTVQDSIEKFLSKNERQITTEQNDYIIKSIAISKSRYHLNLLMEDAISWSSYEAPSPDFVPLSLDEMIGQRFTFIEQQSGEVIVAHSMRYLLLSANGLSEMEILDLLSCNNEVILACYPHALPSVIRVESSQWINIKHQLGSFLTMQYCDNKWLISLHPEVRHVARDRYLHHHEDIRQGHVDIAQLFLESWLGSKPLMDKERQISLMDQGNRFVCQQPLLYSETCYNLRRVNQLWYHLLHAGEIESFKEYTYGNFEYMLATAHAGGVQNLLANLQTTIYHLLDAQLYLILQTIKQSLGILQNDPLQLANEIIGRLKQLIDYYPSYIEPLVTQCMQWCDSYTLPLVVPLTTWLPDIRKQTLVRMQIAVTVTYILPLPNSQHVFCATSDHHICMYHVPLKKLVNRMSGHTGTIHCMVLSYNSRSLASGGADCTVRLWDIVTAQCTHVFSKQNGAVLCLAMTKYNALICGSADSTVIVLDTQFGVVKHTLRAHSKPVTCVLLSANDNLLISSSLDGCVIIWTIEDMGKLNTISVANMAPIICMDLSVDKTFLILGCDDCTGVSSVHVFSFTTGTEIHILSGHSSKVTCLRISTDCLHAVVACDDGSANVYNILTTEMLQRYKPHTQPILSLHVSQCTDLFFTASQTEVCVSNVYKTSVRDFYHHNHDSDITCVKVNSQGRYALSGGKDSSAKLWNLETNSLVESFDGHNGAITCVDIATDEAFIVTGSDDRTVKVWSVTLANIVTNYECHKFSINAAVILPDNRRILSSDVNDSMRVWAADGGQSLLCLTGGSKLVTVSPCGQLAVTGGADSIVHIWNLTSGDVVKTVNHTEPITCVVYSRDSEYLVTGSEDMSLKVWQLATGKLTQVLVEHTDVVTCAAVTCDNKSVISGSRDHDLMIWSTEFGTMEHKLSGHTDEVMAVCLTDDGSVAVSGSLDGTIYIWHTQDGTKLTQFDTHMSVRDVSITYDASHIVVMMGDSWHLPMLCLHNTPASGRKYGDSRDTPHTPIPHPSPEELRVLPMRPRPLLLRQPSSEFPIPNPVKDFELSVSSIPDMILEHSSPEPRSPSPRKAASIPRSIEASTVTITQSQTQSRAPSRQQSVATAETTAVDNNGRKASLERQISEGTRLSAVCSIL